jgi:hypothetical protein
MKKNLLVILTLALLISACSKGTKVCCDVSPFPDYYVFALKADTNWLKTPYTFSYNDSLLIASNGRDEVLSMVIKFNGKGTYPLTAKNAQFYLTTGGDVIACQYRADPETQGSLTITDYNQAAGMITGTYNVRMKRDYRYNPEYFPEYINFEEGKFRVLLPK